MQPKDRGADLGQVKGTPAEGPACATRAPSPPMWATAHTPAANGTYYCRVREAIRISPAEPALAPSRIPREREHYEIRPLCRRSGADESADRDHRIRRN